MNGKESVVRSVRIAKERKCKGRERAQINV